MASTSPYIRLLASIPAFAGLDTEQLRALYGFCALKVLAKAEAAIVAGAGVDELGIVVSGRVTELARGPASQEIGRGEAIEAASFFTQCPASATHVALRETVLLTLSWDDLMAMFRASPALLGTCFRHISTHDAPFAPAPSGPSRLVICAAGAQGRLSPEIKDALLSAMEALAEVRLLARSSFGAGMPGAIALTSPETSHWLQEQELEFDLTVIVADGADLDFAKTSIEEADEILFIASGGDSSLSALEQYASEVRGHGRCRLAVVKGEGISLQNGRDWTRPRRYRTSQSLDFASPDALSVMCSAILGKGNAIAATSSGVYAAAILGALQAFEASGLPPVCLAAAGSAVLPAGLLALGASFSDIEAVFRELENPILWKHAQKVETGLFDPRPIDNILATAVPALDISLAQRPFAAITASLSTGFADTVREGRLRSPIRAGLVPAGILPPLVLDSGALIVSGENETEALFSAIKSLTPSPAFFVYPKPPPLGLSTTPYRRIAGTAPLRLTPFQSPPPLDKRVRLETVLSVVRGHRFPLPFAEGGLPSEPSRYSEADARRRSFSTSRFPGNAATQTGDHADALLPGNGQDAGVLSRHQSGSVFAIPIPDGIMPMDWARWAALRETAYRWTLAELEKRQLTSKHDANA